DEVVALTEGQPAVAKAEQIAPMPLANLHRAIGPPEALALVVGQAVRDQAATEALLDVDRLIAGLEQAQAQLGVLADAPLGPALDPVERGSAHERHGAVLDDGVALVALDHADLEEAGVLPVAPVLAQGLAGVAVVLRRLDEADVGILDMRHQAAQPVGVDDIVAVDDADDLDVGRRLAQREVERAGLEALHALDVEEAEALAELGAPGFDRPPEI